MLSDSRSARPSPPVARRAPSCTSNVVQLATGAWYDPLDPSDPGSMCVHGNANVLTPDVGTSSLSHGCTGQHVLVDVERFDGELPPIRAYDPPVVRQR